MKNEDENRVKADVDNRADEDRAHRCAGMSLAADKGIQSDSQFNKYRSDKINRNIRGSISNRVVTCAEEIQKRCLKDKEKCRQKHGKKEQQGSRTSEDLFCTFPVFLSECDCSKGGTASACKSGECGDDGDNRKCDADTGKR